MVKNIRGGNKHKKTKNCKPLEPKKGPLVYADVNQVYSIIVKKAGGNRLIVDCSDGKTRSAIISGKFFKRVWLNKNDVVLCETVTTGVDDVCTVIHKYSNDDANQLKNEGLIDFNCSNNNEEEGMIDIIDFTDSTNNNNPNNLNNRNNSKLGKIDDPPAKDSHLDPDIDFDDL
jgi:initiation factor 1A